MGQWACLTSDRREDVQAKSQESSPMARRRSSQSMDKRRMISSSTLSGQPWHACTPRGLRKTDLTSLSVALEIAIPHMTQRCRVLKVPSAFGSCSHQITLSLHPSNPCCTNILDSDLDPQHQTEGPSKGLSLMILRDRGRENGQRRAVRADRASVTRLET